MKTCRLVITLRLSHNEYAKTRLLCTPLNGMHGIKNLQLYVQVGIITLNMVIASFLFCRVLHVQHAFFSFSPAVKFLMRLFNILYRRFLSNPTSTREIGYKNYKNKLSSTLRAAKRNYYEKKFEECKSNMKSTWRLLNEIINKRKSRNSVQSSFVIDNKEITDPMEIANHFCEFFTNIGPSLAKMIPPSTSSFRSFLSGSFINSIFLEPITEHEISEISESFRAGTSAGFDQVTMDVVKQTINLIIAPLTHIMNLSLSSGLVPEQMKVARVIPLFKSGTLSLFTNYRPVSVLPAFSKFLEKIVYKRLDSFLNKYKILSCNQYGFRKNHSTAYALIQLYDKLSNAIDQGKVTLGLFIDLSKAFDTVNHDILLAKLEFYGLGG